MNKYWQIRVKWSLKKDRHDVEIFLMSVFNFPLLFFFAIPQF